MPTFEDTFAEGVALSASAEHFLSEAILLSAGFNVGTSTIYASGYRLRERLRLTSVYEPATTYQVTLTRAIRVMEELRTGQTAQAADAVVMDETIAGARAWLLMEELGVADAAIALMTYNITMADQARIRVILERFFGLDLTEAAAITPQMVAMGRHIRGLIDAVAVTPDVTPQLILNVVTDVDLTITHTELLEMIFDGRVSDTVLIEALQFDPSGGMTTWCVNTRAGIVTEYRNYVFNSFAQMGRVYLGANETGLYELAGEDDDGSDIVASIRGGFLQLNSSRFTGLKGVYLGVRGGGEFFLKIQTPAGEEYVYRVLARDMETTKVNIGKGLRHRYLGFELVSTGQDFDLESVEFVPMQAGRRV